LDVPDLEPDARPRPNRRISTGRHLKLGAGGAALNCAV
jgi:hypothetical protein